MRHILEGCSRLSALPPRVTWPQLANFDMAKDMEATDLPLTPYVFTVRANRRLTRTGTTTKPGLVSHHTWPSGSSYTQHRASANSTFSIHLSRHPRHSHHGEGHRESVEQSNPKPGGRSRHGKMWI